MPRFTVGTPVSVEAELGYVIGLDCPNSKRAWRYIIYLVKAKKKKCYFSNEVKEYIHPDLFDYDEESFS